jgi:sugar/nucleoside kinase (ribokinase family)
MMRPLCTVGNVNVDLIMGPLAPWPRAGTEVILEDDDLRVGGAAGNAALAWLGLGHDFTIVASIGDDGFGRWLAAAFGDRAKGWPVVRSSTTISVGVTHPNDERTFLTTRGHLPKFGWADVRPQLSAALSGGLLLLCGTNVTPVLADEYDAVFAWAAAHRVEVALDTGWPVNGWTEAERARVTDWLPHVGHLLLNEIEVMGLTGTDTLNDALGALASILPGTATAAIKTGPRGAILRTAAGWMVVPPRPIAVLDTIGAGDVFNAGYLSAVAQGAPLAKAVERGIATAAIALSTQPRRYTEPQTEAAQ